MSTPTPSPTSRRRRLRLYLAAVIVLLVAAVAGGWWWRGTHPSVLPVPDVALDGAEADVRAAITRAREGVLAEPRSAKAWGDLGMVLRAHGYDTEADACFQEAGTLDPADARWRYYRGLYALLRDPGNALPHLRRAAELTRPASRHETAVRLRLAEALVERGELDEAEKLVRGVLSETPDDPRANYDLALMMLARGDPRAAQASLGVAAGSPFTRQKAAARMATAARLLGDSTAAARYEQQARTMPADLPWIDSYVTDYTDLQAGIQARFQLAENLKAEGRWQEAIAETVAIALAHPSPRSYVAAGIALAERGDYSTAERYLRACLEIDPDHIQGNYFLAVTLFFVAEQGGAVEPARERYRECAEKARRCLACKPDHGLAYQFLGRALHRLGDPAGAVRELRSGAACRPEMVESHLYLAEALLAAGDRDEARKSLTAAEQIAGPDEKRVRQLRERVEKKE